MIETQRTITREVTLSGRGLHTGKECNLTFKPAPPGSWIVFRRTDLPGKPEIKATLDNVKEIARGTFLGRGDTEIKTVEHCLAAVSGLQIDNIIVEIDNEEVPVLDGSAKPFVDALLTAGFQDQGIPRDIFNIQDVIQYSQRDGDNVIDIHSIPYKDFRITFMVDYQKPLGTQYTTLRSLEEDFAENFAPARTFSFLSEVSTLFKMGLIKGGTLSNALVIADRPLTEEDISYMRDKLKIKGPIFEGENGFLNGVEPQFPNEPVRHKVVDLIGDLALLGFPIKGHIIAARSGHKSNIELAKLIRKQHDKWRISSKYRTISKDKGVVIDTLGIQKILPHRYPFLMLDKIVDIEEKKRVVAIKNISINEPFFRGHFPGHPIMPGVLIIEAMAQAGAFLILSNLEEENRKVAYFMGIDRARFRNPVHPGDQLRIEVDMINFRRSIARFKAKATVKGKIACEAEIMAAAVDAEKI
ncbi:UDP-3-O-[3-hydroxymyristoyl] N-acetylglucosamine deacetylase [bacterium]|nr:MAG: UDP-3-O-[3-hydroxymyristoyl] N-acetylglucosamine deacetylase [bacterium]